MSAENEPMADADAGTGHVGTANLENAADIALTAFCWWRADLPRHVCEDYWRDVHGIMFARAPGLWQARQLRLSPNRPDLWPAVSGMSFDVPRAAQPQGLPHGLFRSEADLAAFGDHPLAQETIPNDAHHFIGRIGSQLSSGGRTLVDGLDGIDGPTVQGSPPAPTFVLCFVPRAKAVSTKDFHRFLTEHIARPWSEHPDVLRLRVEPLPPYAESVMASPGVPDQWPSDETYLGWIELSARNEDVFDDLLSDVLGNDLAEQVEAVHTYPVREIYTIISAGRPTDVGLRGYPAVRTIMAAGVDEQRDRNLLELLYGEAVHGLDRLRR
ncbi:ethyl tert-butyl ether degradation protein EthD [Nocardiopsis aegyptia]|uniref:ethyl tert-butyl ether degradation protein EthD n=1 Tax=Nocardiopsis aegyptia TaxID=220378 RepID=UPI00366C69E7